MLIQVNPAVRYTARRAWTDAWVKDCGGLKDKILTLHAHEERCEHGQGIDMVRVACTTVGGEELAVLHMDRSKVLKFQLRGFSEEVTKASGLEPYDHHVQLLLPDGTNLSHVGDNTPIAAL